jgi:hypothetical protein
MMNRPPCDWVPFLLALMVFDFSFVDMIGLGEDLARDDWMKIEIETTQRGLAPGV